MELRSRIAAGPERNTAQETAGQPASLARSHVTTQIGWQRAKHRLQVSIGSPASPTNEPTRRRCLLPIRVDDRLVKQIVAESNLRRAAVYKPIGHPTAAYRKLEHLR
ncbi:hypothetical protein QR680_012531 [Steinernema hermaphroditum]|uniref:Uncharacterized protein n=1 Tax=Steinernema hermaphroditum TaxID=289476 RepID=A0AA39M0N6_9BILA|nr:hypothetical protein QR680_012531 [Steinernema hermaphroditum]